MKIKDNSVFIGITLKFQIQCNGKAHFFVAVCGCFVCLLYVWWVKYMSKCKSCEHIMCTCACLCVCLLCSVGVVVAAHEFMQV